jgi:NAD-dependent dihydropyrimidine dehydrogenase PreA subunit
MQGLRYLPGVTTLQFDEDACNGCGICTSVCPHAVFEIDGRKARIVDRDACIECGACALNCPTEALSVNAGVGCAAAVIKGWVTGQEPTCGCDCC